MTYLSNLASDKLKENDEIIRMELIYAGLGPQDKCSEFIYDGEVKATVYAIQYEWTFIRAWSYWVAKGNGIPVGPAMELWKKWGDVVRTEGHCQCPSPLWYNKGLGTGLYHIDSMDGLKALVDTLKTVYDAGASDDSGYEKGGWVR